MRIDPCFVCGASAYPGSGTMFVRNDGKTFRFCRSKCHKNFKMKRNPRRLAWTKAFRKAAGKEMAVDASLEFEKRRNVPVKYDRELVATTIKAMDRIATIKARREKAFYAARMAAAAPVEEKARANEIVKNRHVLGARESEATLKALKAAEKKLEAIEQEEQERKASRRAGKVRDTTGMDVEEALEEMDEDLEEDVAAPQRMVEKVPSRGEKMKVKIKARTAKQGKVRSSLAAGGGRSMDLD